jgi:hypothetical protein
MFQPSGKIRKIRQGERGFSVVEMAIVFLIIAIIVAAFVPQAIVWMRLYRLNVGARNVATTLQRARYLATSNNQRVGISINDFQHMEVIQFSTDPNVEPIVKGRLDMPEGISLSDDAPKQIAFDGRGILTPMPRESPVIRVQSFTGYYINVTISPTGQISMSDPVKGDKK